jgi:hypothetical protein
VSVPLKNVGLEAILCEACFPWANTKLEVTTMVDSGINSQIDCSSHHVRSLGYAWLIDKVGRCILKGVTTGDSLVVGEGKVEDPHCCLLSPHTSFPHTSGHSEVLGT